MFDQAEVCAAWLTQGAANEARSAFLHFSQAAAMRPQHPVWSVEPRLAHLHFLCFPCYYLFCYIFLQRCLLNEQSVLLHPEGMKKIKNKTGTGNEMKDHQAA